MFLLSECCGEGCTEMEAVAEEEIIFISRFTLRESICCCEINPGLHLSCYGCQSSVAALVVKVWRAEATAVCGGTKNNRCEYVGGRRASVIGKPLCGETCLQLTACCIL